MCVRASLALAEHRYCDDLVGQFEAVVAKLVQLHPSHSTDEARSLLVRLCVEEGLGA